MNSRIINGEAVTKHNIDKYTFKTFDDENKNNTCDNSKKENQSEEMTKQQPQQQQPQQQNTVNSEVVEKLLGKIEELSNNIVNIQVQFEKQLNECKTNAQKEKDLAFEEGYKKAKEEIEAKYTKEFEEKITLLNKSIEKLDSVYNMFEEKILSIEKELIAVALDIAKEVIQKEVSENSKEIALSLAKALMEDVKDATKIEIKANPKDVEYLKSNLKNVQIVADDAIKEGGVVIMSDIGNIDAQIIQRFKAIKEAILEGQE